MLLLHLRRPAGRLAARRFKSIAASPRRLKSIAATPDTAPDIVIVNPLKTAAPASTILVDLPDRAALTPTQLMNIASELGKSRLSGFVAMTGAMGYAATGAPLLAPGFALTTLGVFGTSCAANALNQIRETERDARMARTRKRPLPSGRCTPEFAATFAGVAGGAGASALAVLDPVASALAVGNMALYAGAYTSLKPKSEINTWVGAVVGALPPVMGWTAAGGALLSPEAAALSGVLFLWQIPHFLALAWMYRADYAKGGYHMLPLADPTGAKTAAVCLEYSVYLTLLPFCCWATGLTSCMFTVESAVFNGAMLLAAWRFAEDPKLSYTR